MYFNTQVIALKSGAYAEMLRMLTSQEPTRCGRAALETSAALECKRKGPNRSRRSDEMGLSSPGLTIDRRSTLAEVDGARARTLPWQTDAGPNPLRTLRVAFISVELPN